MFKLFLAEVVDKFTQENFRKITDYLRADTWRKGTWTFLEAPLAKIDASATYPATATALHRLNFQPKDLILFSITPDTATVTPLYDSFTKTHVAFTVSEACTIKAYLGRYGER